MCYVGILHSIFFKLIKVNMWCVWFIKIKKRQLFFVHILHNSVSRSLKPCWPNKHQQTFDMTLPQASEVIPFWAVISYFPFPSCLHRHVPIPQKLWFLLAVFPVCDIQTGIDGARGYVCVVYRLRLTLCHLLAACECQGASGHSPTHHWFTCFPSCPCVLSLPHWLRPGEGVSLHLLLARLLSLSSHLPHSLRRRPPHADVTGAQHWLSSICGVPSAATLPWPLTVSRSYKARAATEGQSLFCQGPGALRRTCQQKEGWVTDTMLTCWPTEVSQVRGGLLETCKVSVNQASLSLSLAVFNAL